MPIADAEIIQWIRQEDPAANTAAREAGANFPRELERALPTLSESSREVATQALAAHNTREAARVLLDMTGDKEPQVATAAARALGDLSQPPSAGELLFFVGRRSEPVVRSVLYRLVGRVGTAPELATLRTVLEAEQDPEAGEDGQVAAVRLGGATEKAAFMQRIRVATPDTAQRVCDQLRYVGQKPLLKALLPWLGNREEVMRLGSDRGTLMARMCDLAVWTASEMGATLDPKPAFLENYSQATLDHARSVLLALPDS